MKTNIYYIKGLKSYFSNTTWLAFLGKNNLAYNSCFNSHLRIIPPNLLQL